MSNNHPLADVRKIIVYPTPPLLTETLPHFNPYWEADAGDTCNRPSYLPRHPSHTVSRTDTGS